MPVMPNAVQLESLAHGRPVSPAPRATRSLAVLLTTVLSASALPAFAQTAGRPPEAKKADAKAPEDVGGEVKTIKRKADPKKAGAAKSKADAGPKQMGPEQRRDREKSSVEDIDDELAILRELLEIERGSETEADTLLEISYVLWDRAEAYETEAFDEEIEVCINGEADPIKQSECKAKQQALLEQSRAAKLDVINFLKRIERAFPRFAKLDEVLYSLGFHLQELERPGEAVDAYMRLVRKVPKSSYLPDAYLGIGNYYFSKNQGAEAVKYYTKVTEFPDSAVYGWGLYYLAWVAYNQSQWDVAVKGFIRVLDYSQNEAKGRIAFVEDSSRYLVRSWAEIGKPRDALAFFKKVAPGAEVLLLDQLALYYAEVSQFEKSNIALDQLIEFAKDDAQMLRYVSLRLENSYKLHDLAETVKSAEMVSASITAGGKLTQKRSDNLELLLAEIGTSFHAEYERTLLVPVVEAAEKIYRVYGRHFADGPNAYEIANNHALALVQLQRWSDSAAMYEKVIEMQPTGKYAESAALRSLIAYIKLQDLNNVTSEKDQDLADVRPIPLTPEEERVAKACVRYIDVSEKNGNKEDGRDPSHVVHKATFVAARMYYQKNQFDQAIPLLQKYVARYPDAAYAYDSARLLISALWLAQDGKGLREWVDKLIKDERFNKEDLGKTLTEFKRNEEYNKCLELKDTPVPAAQCLTKYAVAFKDNKEQAAAALNGAARFYLKAKKKEEAIAAYRELAKQFPEDKRGPLALFDVALIHNDSADFRAAADAFEEFVKTFPSHEKVPQALATATRYRELLGDYDKVVEDGELFLSTFSKDERAAAVAYNVTVQYVNKGDWAGVIRASDKFLKRSDKIPMELRLAAMVNTGTAQFKLAKKGDKGKKLFDEVLKIATELANNKQLAELPQIGRDAIAQTLFMLGEIEFDKVKAIKGKPKKLDDATKLVTDKVTKAKVADGFYTQAEETKNPRWVAAAASRRGRIYQDIGLSIRDLPPPDSFKGNMELTDEWKVKMAEKAQPQFDLASERYKEAIRKSAELFAFDTYWKEAVDNLKQLDTKFAEQVDVKEQMAELTPAKWQDSTKPEVAVRDMRAKLFELSAGEALDESTGAATAQPEATAQAGNPEVAKAYAKLAEAHHAQGQLREAVFVSSYGIRNTAELKKSAAAFSLLGHSYYNLGQLRDALVAWEEAAKVDEKAVEPLLNAAAVTVRSLDFVNTVRLLEEVLKRDPNNYWAQVTWPVAARRLTDGIADQRKIWERLESWAQKDNRPELQFNRCAIGQAVLTVQPEGTDNAAQRENVKLALETCKAAQKAVPASHPKAKELATRVKTLEQTLEFLPQ
jgi:tetratricopeptide (TPR) repeat protein